MLAKIQKKVCPLNHEDGLIPIEYGVASEKMKKQAEKGKIFLVGCLTADCDPKWYCKIHDIKF